MELKGILSVIFLIFLRCHFGSALTCYSCNGECADNKNVTCSQDEQCMTSYTKSGDGKVQDLKAGCLNKQYCTNTEGFSMVQKCCDKDLCNDPKSVSGGVASPLGADNSRETPLRCYSCDFPCTFKSEITCQNQQKCVTKTARFGGVNYHKRGCANSTMCDTNTPESLAGTTVSANNKCCDTDLCNSGAAYLEIPAVTLLAAIVSVWMSKLW